MAALAQTVADPSAEAIRVLVVDDSAVVRGLLARQLQTDPRIMVVASCGDGQQALRKVEQTAIDVVLLDVEMPVMDGLTALPLILAARPGVRVIMVSAQTAKMADASLKALRLGAIDCIHKPEGSLVAADAFNLELVTKVKAVSAGPRVRREEPAPVKALRVASPPATTLTLVTTRPPPLGRTTPQAVAIGGSTGGPAALMTVFESLKTVRQPILVTQHMPANFTAALAEHLARISGKVCAEAVDGEPVTPGRVYVAPGGWHMTVSRDGALPVIKLNQEPPEHFCRPAVDPMLKSMAKVYGPSLVAIILTGMGADGAAGCQAVAGAGGRFIVQDETTSVVWGMPGAAAKTGLAEDALPVDQIGPWIARTAGATP